MYEASNDPISSALSLSNDKFYAKIVGKFHQEKIKRNKEWDELIDLMTRERKYDKILSRSVREHNEEERIKKFEITSLEKEQADMFEEDYMSGYTFRQIDNRLRVDHINKRSHLNNLKVFGVHQILHRNIMTEIRSGDVVRIVKQFEKYNQDPSVASQVLINLTLLLSNQMVMISKFLKCNGVQLLINTITGNQTSIKVPELGIQFTTFARKACFHDGFCEEFVKLGGIAVITRVMEQHPDIIPILSNGLHTCSMCIEKKGIQFVEDFLENNNSDILLQRILWTIEKDVDNPAIIVAGLSSLIWMSMYNEKFVSKIIMPSSTTTIEDNDNDNDNDNKNKSTSASSSYEIDNFIFKALPKFGTLYTFHTRKDASLVTQFILTFINVILTYAPTEEICLKLLTNERMKMCFSAIITHSDDPVVGIIASQFIETLVSKKVDFFTSHFQHFDIEIIDILVIYMRNFTNVSILQWRLLVDLMYLIETNPKLVEHFLALDGVTLLGKSLVANVLHSPFIEQGCRFILHTCAKNFRMIPYISDPKFGLGDAIRTAAIIHIGDEGIQSSARDCLIKIYDDADFDNDDEKDDNEEKEEGV